MALVSIAELKDVLERLTEAMERDSEQFYEFRLQVDDGIVAIEELDVNNGKLDSQEQIRLYAALNKALRKLSWDLGGLEGQCREIVFLIAESEDHIEDLSLE